MREGADATRWSLLVAAAELFDQHGYTGTSISAISRRCGLTSGAVYFHYAGKQHLARAVIEQHFASWPALISQAEQRPIGCMLDRIVNLSYAVAAAFRDDIIVRAGGRLWLERRTIGVPLPPPFTGWIDTLTGLLEAAQAEGSVAARVDPRAAAGVLVCSFFGTHTVSDALDGRRLIEQRLTDLWLCLLPGLAPETGAGAAALLSRARAYVDVC